MKKTEKFLNLAILASGNGSNAARFIRHFHDHPVIRVGLIVSNNASAYVLERAGNAGLPAEVIPGPDWENEEKVKAVFHRYQIDAVVLAGYMRLIPPFLIRMFPNRIFNIHPALLPDFGGKGMYGKHVHRAVLESGAEKSGITIHLVNEEYDKGRILFQEEVAISPTDTPESLAAKVQQLEHYHYPRVVEAELLQAGA